MKQVFKKCANCGNSFVGIEGEGLGVCQSCFDSFPTCTNCGRIDKDGSPVRTTKDPDEWFCNDCIDVFPIYECENCSEYFLFHDTDHCGYHTKKGESFCDFCGTEEYSCFGQCGFPECRKDVYYYQNHVILDGKYHHLDCILKHSEILFRKI